LHICVSRSKKPALAAELAADHHLNREGVIERLRDEAYEMQIVPNFQRVTISGEETSGVWHIMFQVHNTIGAHDNLQN
jgi:hypothetical protein